MSIPAVELRKLRELASAVLRRLTETALVDSFTWSAEMPEGPGQYWEYQLTIWNDLDEWYDLPCGCFTGAGRLRNTDLGIDLFFDNNDRVLDEIEAAFDDGRYNDLMSLLASAELLAGSDGVEGRAAINVHAHAFTDDEWYRAVCEEYVLIIHIGEKDARKLDVGNQQNERYRIGVPTPHGRVILRVPFDKVQLFDGYQRVDQQDRPYFEYEVALSFAGEDRGYVSDVANHLRHRRIRLFYDEYERTALWGKDLYVHLDEVYRKKARFCVMFLSTHYKQKLWTNHERESAQARAFEENREYILPVRLDSTEIPGIRPTLGYIDGKEMTPKELADLIFRKVRGA